VQLLRGLVKATELSCHHECLDTIEIYFHESIVNQNTPLIFLRVVTKMGQFAGYNASIGA
jgi:hypothetical protein